tara:strand:+ start:92 stop:529 length:438 start_codon:yes stop_codon:yes gene_type:complete
MSQIEPSFILLDQDFKDKSEALLNLVDILDEKGCLNNKQKYLDSIIEREKMLSTYCGHNIAIPHAISKAVEEISYGFCRTNSMEWDKNDDPVKYILILAIPDIERKSDNYHIDLMSQVASIALEEGVRNIWEKAITEKEILKTFQ